VKANNAGIFSTPKSGQIAARCAWINQKLRGKQTKQKRRRSSGPRIKHLPRMNISFFAPCFAGLTYALKNEAQPVGHAKNQTEGN
jgi:hypothetical protein